MVEELSGEYLLSAHQQRNYPLAGPDWLSTDHLVGPPVVQQLVEQSRRVGSAALEEQLAQGQLRLGSWSRENSPAAAWRKPCRKWRQGSRHWRQRQQNSGATTHRWSRRSSTSSREADSQRVSTSTTHKSGRGMDPDECDRLMGINLVDLSSEEDRFGDGELTDTENPIEGVADDFGSPCGLTLRYWFMSWCCW